MLTSLDVVAGAGVFDLFAGTGALGVEALSRGAATVTFVDDDRAALEMVRANLATTGFSDRAAVVRADVLRWLETAGRADLAFADPPYAFEAWPTLLGVLKAELAVLESNDVVEPAEGWEVLKVKHYGDTVVTLTRPMKGRS